nr:DUF4282 domain-containing protein [Phenylobacterium immobile]
MRRALTRPDGAGGGLIWDLLTFERLVTSNVVHLIYWAGLALIFLVAFGGVGAAVGVAIREGSILGVLLAIPVLAAGLLVCAILILLWRSFCELYVAVFRISDDLAALRKVAENSDVL